MIAYVRLAHKVLGYRTYSGYQEIMENLQQSHDSSGVSLDNAR